MYNDIKAVLDACMSLFNMKFELYGYHLSLFNVASFSIVSGLLGWVVWEVLHRD